MYWIKRCYLDGVGFKEAFFRDQTLNLIPKAWAIESNYIPNSYFEISNGCGKTTLISLILTVFEPQKNKFVQTVAGRRKNQNNHYNDYFHDDLSTIIIEMVDDENQLLILGQYHQKRGSDIEVIHFIHDGPIKSGFFEEIPSVGRAKASQNSPVLFRSISDVRQWLNHKNKKTNGNLRIKNTRSEWLKALKEVGINRQMIDSLIIINSEEGGVSHFANYKSEQDFLEKFYACCIPEQDINALAKNCSEQVAKGAELQKLIDKADFYTELDDAWCLFQPHLLQAIQNKKQLNDTKLMMSEYLRDLTCFRDEREKRLEESAIQLAKIKHKIMEDQNNENEFKKELEELKYKIADYELNKSIVELKKAKRKYEAEEKKLLVLQSVGDYRTWRNYAQDFDRLQKELIALQRKEVKPLVKALREAMQKARRVYEDEISRLNASIEKLREEQINCQKTIDQHDSEKSRILKENGNLETEIATHKAIIEEGDKALRKYQSNGILDPNELPNQGQLRLKQKKQQLEEAFQIIVDNLSKVEDERKRIGSQYNESSQNLQLVESNVKNCEKKEKQAQKSYEQIQTEALKIFSDFDANSLYSAKQKLEELNEIRTHYFQKKNNENIKLKNEIDEIERTGHLLVDKIVQKGLQLFHEKGLTKEQIFSFPNYVANIFDDDTEKIAQIVDQNPGKYLGIGVSDAQTLQKVKDILPYISWDSRPVPIYRVTEGELNEVAPVADAVLSSEDKVAYSEKAWKNRIVELKNQLNENQLQIETAKIQKEQIRTLYVNWKNYWKQFGENWTTILQDLDVARNEADKAKFQFESIKIRQSEIFEKEKNIRIQEKALNREYIDLKDNYNEVNNFVKNLWKKKQVSGAKLPELYERFSQQQMKEKELKRIISEGKRNEQKIFQQLLRNKDELRRLKRDLANSSFANEPSFSRAIPGLSPEDSKEIVGATEKSLEQVKQGPKIKSKRKEVELTEHKRNTKRSHLDSLQGWSKYEKEVIQFASYDNYQVELLLAEQPGIVKRFEKKVLSCEKDKDDCDSRFQAAKLKRPSNFHVEGDYDSWKNRLPDLLRALEQIKNTILICQGELKELEKQHDRIGKDAARCIKLLSIIELYTHQASTGKKQKVSLDEIEPKIYTARSQYLKCNDELKDSYGLARAGWGEFQKLITKEESKELKKRRCQSAINNFQGLHVDLFLDSEQYLINKTKALRDCKTAAKVDIDIHHRSMESLTKELLSHLQYAIRLLQKARNIKIPKKSPVHPGKKIFKMSDKVKRLDSSDALFAVCQKSLDQWIINKCIPDSNGRNDALTAYLIQQLFPEGELQIGLIKAIRTERANYFKINRTSGSGGQLLTSAFLLYMAIAKIRDYQNNQGYGFMIADNPIGECNADELVRTQLEMARFVGVQLVYFTGHPDKNAQSMFDQKIFMGRIEKLKNGYLIGQKYQDQDKDTNWYADLNSESFLTREI